MNFLRVKFETCTTENILQNAYSSVALVTVSPIQKYHLVDLKSSREYDCEWNMATVTCSIRQIDQIEFIRGYPSDSRQSSAYRLKTEICIQRENGFSA